MAISTFLANHDRENNTGGTPITINPHRRMLLRRTSPSSSSSSTPSTSPTRNSSISLHNIFHHVQNSRPTSPAPKPQIESDEECWERMLDLQMLNRSFMSARLDAAVEARRSGCSMEEIPRRKFPFHGFEVETDTLPASRLCLDLLNEEFNAKLEAEQRIQS